MGVEDAPEDQRRVPVLSPVRRRRRRRGGRTHQVMVRLDDEELTAIAAQAAASRLTVASYLAAAGSRDSTSGAGGGGWSVEQRHALVAELFTVQRVLRGVATNLNQLTALANTQREIPPAVAATADAAGRLMTRVEQVVDALDPVKR